MVVGFVEVLVLVCGFDLIVIVLECYIVLFCVGLYVFELLLVLMFFIVFLFWYLWLDGDVVYCWLCVCVCEVCVLNMFEGGLVF